MAVVAGWAPVEKALELLYAAVRDMTLKSVMMKPQISELESKLQCLRPLISVIAKNDINLDLDPDLDLKELQIQLERGYQLIIGHLKVMDKRLPHKKKTKFATKLQEFSSSLDPCLDRLKLHHAYVIEVVKMNKIIQQLAEERLMTTTTIAADDDLPITSNSVDATVKESEAIQVLQPFARRMQNLLVNGRYGSWRIVFMIPFLLSIVMAATGSTAGGTKWIVFNIGFNNLGINDN